MPEQTIKDLKKEIYLVMHKAQEMLELTEDAFAAKGTFQTHVLPVLREIGVRVSIDDFGTGYSSLSALADITADEV